MRFLALLPLLAACSACAHAQHSSPAQQWTSSVAITTICPGGGQTGTGVMVSDDRVLTARHVVTCELLPNSGITVPPEKIVVGLSETQSAEVFIDAEAPEGDLARLRMVDPVPGFYHEITVGPLPELGDEICVASSRPRPVYRCYNAQPVIEGKVVWDGITEHGQSGSPIYDSRGRLVGILTNMIPCSGEGRWGCEGFGTYIGDYRWLLPES